MLKQAMLRIRKEPLQIPYPSDWTGQKSSGPEEEEVIISTEPRWLTEDEIPLVEAFIKTLPYSQFLDLTGAVLIDPNDSLLNASHDDLDRADAAAGFPNTRYLPGGGQRSVQERVLILRERGYVGNGSTALKEVV
jgi:hypothetical protein